MCAENPLAQLFGPPAVSTTPAARESGKKKSSEKKQAQQKAKISSRNEAAFQPRSEEEIAEVTKKWLQYAHPRAQEFFSSPEVLQEVLVQLARGIDRNDDPVLGDEEKCCWWYGDVTKEDLQAAIRMVKPGETSESVTYVNRVLAFIFATDDSFEQLMKLPKEPFKMSCGDQLCVHLAHISLAV